MTPQEKAKELFMRNFEITVDDYCAKQCALIAVNEIINSNPHSNPMNTYGFSTMAYWMEVKQEIDKL